jgi:hypothetical protein
MFRDQPLRGFRKQLRQRERCDALDDGCREYRQNQRLQQLHVMLRDDAVD